MASKPQTKLASTLVHLAARLANWQGNRRFRQSFKQTENVQRQQLSRILKTLEGTETAIRYGLTPDMSWEQFRQAVPVTEYSDWSEQIERQRKASNGLLSNSPCRRYQPTSGSTSKVKWIPYTKAFLSELDAAVAPMMADMYRLHPGIKKGKHYWSFSWVPTELRQAISADINNDLKLLPWWKRLFMTLSSAVPETISMADTSDDSLFATLCYLLQDRELSFLSVWSPTFALSLLDGLVLHREELAEVLQAGNWGKRADSLQDVPCPHSSEISQWLTSWDGELTPSFLEKLWPNLALISAWDTSTSAIWAKQLKTFFPQANFQGKGLWATEGVVTIPWQGKYPLALCSHFYEFLDINSGKIYPAWGLHIGQEVRPLLTTGSGLLRYAMKDRLRVVDYIRQCPCFEFKGRVDGVDMVGEKLSPEVADEILRQLSDIDGNGVACRPISLLAITAELAQQKGMTNQKPFYLLLCELDKGANDKCLLDLQQKLSQSLEKQLRKHFHYSLARDIGQLAPAQVYCSEDARALYMQRGTERGMVSGNIKIEPLMLWDTALPESAFTALSESEPTPGVKVKGAVLNQAEAVADGGQI